MSFHTARFFVLTFCESYHDFKELESQKAILLHSTRLVFRINPLTIRKDCINHALLQICINDIERVDEGFKTWNINVREI